MGIKLGTSDISKLYLGTQEISKMYKGTEEIYSSSGYLCFFNENSNLAYLELLQYGTPSYTGTAYSRDGKNWISYTPSTTIGSNKISIARNERIYFKNTITGNFTTTNYLQFIGTSLLKISGNCNSMYAGDNYSSVSALTYTLCFYKLFESTGVYGDVLLPATTLSSGCYAHMFSCSRMTKTPELPALATVSSCYQSMFYRCTHLTSISNIAATTAADFSCYEMFFGCTSLTTGVELKATTLADNCYAMMFYECTSLASAGPILATDLASQCFSAMFKGCTSLTTIPRIRGLLAAYSCYNMFGGCSNVKMSENVSSEYPNSYYIPGTKDGVTSDPTSRMFENTGGTTTTVSSVPKTLRTSNTVV